MVTPAAEVDIRMDPYRPALIGAGFFVSGKHAHRCDEHYSEPEIHGWVRQRQPQEDDKRVAVDAGAFGARAV